MLYSLTKLTCLSLGLYCSFKAVRSRNKEKGMQWLMFWIVMAFYRATEFWADIFLGWWLPFYGYFKLFAILFVLFTQPWGSEAVYKQHLRPLFRSNQYHIEDFKKDYGSYVMSLSKVVVSISVALTSVLFSSVSSDQSNASLDKTPSSREAATRRSDLSPTSKIKAVPTSTSTSASPTKKSPGFNSTAGNQLKNTQSLNDVGASFKTTKATRSISDIRKKFQLAEEKTTLTGRKPINGKLNPSKATLEEKYKKSYEQGQHITSSRINSRV
ncbi:hypothetical protein K7432_001451 [Basidiobolus ranarum]|uniref:Protein YOP1 n=1 Tax=Basidiobolus ranarum TaxID=34480 RepID=A0ABR2W9K0_9FUNG